MRSYSIVKIGGGYVVKVGDQSVMTVGSRRKAARLVAMASRMLAASPGQDAGSRTASSAAHEP
ncbi:hypothetical protein [Tardiphaga sp.]|jgi:hypothetical protein|uniref:hypothetical protein n=1 Tax=Tardiphaga sp. TaxID=1926292 RepID=UPI0019C64E80|nr:hypothetical protein [Tardiphaga sp.]MBC7578600.1 hypothetical protein [Tardiphaga sp.]